METLKLLIIAKLANACKEYDQAKGNANPGFSDHLDWKAKLPLIKSKHQDLFDIAKVAGIDTYPYQR